MPPIYLQVFSFQYIVWIMIDAYFQSQRKIFNNSSVIWFWLQELFWHVIFSMTVILKTGNGGQFFVVFPSWWSFGWWRRPERVSEVRHYRRWLRRSETSFFAIFDFFSFFYTTLYTTLYKVTNESQLTKK